MAGTYPIQPSCEGRDGSTLLQSTQTVAKNGVTRPFDAHALSPTERRLYAALAAHVGEELPAEDLQVQLWGEVTPATAAYLTLYARFLRRKLAADPSSLRLVYLRRGGGYALCVATASPPASSDG